MKKSPYKVYEQLKKRKEAGDPSVDSQWDWLQRSVDRGDIQVGPPPSGALETAANAFAREASMGLAPESLSEQPQFLAGEEEHPTAAGLGAALPYLAGGAGAIKGLLSKALGRKAAAKAASQAQIDEGFKAAKDTIDYRQKLGSVAQGGEFTAPVKELADPAFQDALFQGMKQRPSGRRQLGVKDELEELLRQVQTRQSNLDKNPALQQFHRQKIDKTRVK